MSTKERKRNCSTSPSHQNEKKRLKCDDQEQTCMKNIQFENQPNQLKDIQLRDCTEITQREKSISPRNAHIKPPADMRSPAHTCNYDERIIKSPTGNYAMKDTQSQSGNHVLQDMQCQARKNAMQDTQAPACDYNMKNMQHIKLRSGNYAMRKTPRHSGNCTLQESQVTSGNHALMNIQSPGSVEAYMASSVRAKTSLQTPAFIYSPDGKRILIQSAAGSKRFTRSAADPKTSNQSQVCNKMVIKSPSGKMLGQSPSGKMFVQSQTGNSARKLLHGQSEQVAQNDPDYVKGSTQLDHQIPQETSDEEKNILKKKVMNAFRDICQGIVFHRNCILSNSDTTSTIQKELEKLLSFVGALRDTMESVLYSPMDDRKEKVLSLVKNLNDYAKELYIVYWEAITGDELLKLFHPLNQHTFGELYMQLERVEYIEYSLGTHISKLSQGAKTSSGDNLK